MEEVADDSFQARKVLKVALTLRLMPRTYRVPGNHESFAGDR
jgi:hypothetical protein